MGRWGVGLGGQSGCEIRIEVFVKIQKKKNFFFGGVSGRGRVRLGGRGGGGVRGVRWGGVGSGGLGGGVGFVGRGSGWM